MTDYPILVKRLTPEQAVMLVCPYCGAEETINAADIRNEQDYGCRCGRPMTYKYVEAYHECPNCQRLGFFNEATRPCCSRLCALQWEYALQLQARRA